MAPRYLVFLMIWLANAEQICITEDCVKASASITEKRDTSVDPCEDFAEYACGNFYKTTALEEGEDIFSTQSAIQAKTEQILRSILEEPFDILEPTYRTSMKQYYQSCINETSIEEIGHGPYTTSSRANEWPTLIGQNWPGEANFDVNDVMVSYMKDGVNPMFSASVEIDTATNSRHILQLKYPVLGLSEWKYRRAQTSSSLQTYELYLKEFATALGADPEVAAQDATAQVDLEKKLAKIIPQSYRFFYSSPSETKTTLGALQQKYPHIDLARGIRNAFSQAKVTLPDDQDIYLKSPSYFQSLQTVLNTTDKRSLMNLFGFKYAQQKAGDLTRELRDIKKNLYNYKARGRKATDKPRKEICLEETKKAFELGLFKEFTSRTLCSDSRNYVNGMVDRIKDSLRKTLETSWLSNTTKPEALEKVDKMSQTIGYPDTNFDNMYLNKLYENMSMVANKYYRNRQTAFWDKTIKSYQSLNTPTNKNTWQVEFQPYAYYSMLDNQIIFQAGILQPPYFSSGYPDVLNYGALGSIIAHKIMRGFDNFGMNYDANGIRRGWWSDGDQAVYQENLQCFVDQYGEFTLDSKTADASSYVSRGEKMADTMGLEESFRAYRKLVEDNGEGKRLPGLDLTNNQLFFLGYAQMFCEVQSESYKNKSLEWGFHSMGRFRIIGPVQNSDEFAAAYNCPQNSMMNARSTKCQMW